MCYKTHKIKEISIEDLNQFIEMDMLVNWFTKSLIERMAKAMCNRGSELEDKILPMFDDTKLSSDAKLFINMCIYNIHREGIYDLLQWLVNETDFVEAPCSTRYHLCVPGGLVKHSINVFTNMRTLADTFLPLDVSIETVAIVSLLHDVCKVNTYKPCKKSRKTGKLLSNGKPEWEDYTGYDFDEDFPYGHGEKSVYLIQKYMHLTDEESMAIRWHMGYSDSTFKGGSQSVSNAMVKYPLIALLHSADVISTVMENTTK